MAVERRVGHAPNDHTRDWKIGEDYNEEILPWAPTRSALLKHTFDNMKEAVSTSMHARSLWLFLDLG